MDVDAWRELWRIACRLFWNLKDIEHELGVYVYEAKHGSYQIWTLRADILSRFANSARSSVVGKAVRLYVSFRTLSCSASARLRFFLMEGSDTGCSGAYVDVDAMEGLRG